jgi:hypothetical protein
MSPSEYLAGKVVKWSLPVISGRPGPAAPALKRLLLPQGELAQIHDSDKGIHYLAVLEVRADSIRGNHYHKVKVEWVYVTQASLLVLVQDIQTNERASVTLETGDMLLIQPGIAHLLKTIEPGHALEFSPTRFDAADIYPFSLG